MSQPYELMRKDAQVAGLGFAGLNYKDPTGLRHALWRRRTASPFALPEKFEKRRLTALLSELVLGMDISHWNDDLVAEFWDAAYAAGFRFVFLKATEGTGFVDNRFEINLARAKAAGFLAWSYHYYRPRYDGVEQADFAMRVAGDAVVGVAQDLEEDDGQPDNVINSGSALFLSVLNRTYGHSWMYSAAWFLDARRGINPNVPYLRWPAHWNLYVTEPYLPAIWRADGRWDCWQYSAQGTVAGRHPIDLNRMPREVYNRFDPASPCDIDPAAVLEFADRLESMGDEMGAIAAELRSIVEGV